MIEAEPASWSFAETDPSVAPDAPVSSGGLRREIFGFLPYWELSDSIDPARLGEAVDGRVLRGRCQFDGQPHQEEQRRDDDRRLERLDELEDDERHQRGPHEPHACRPDGAELRLDGQPARQPEGAPRILHRPAQPGPAGRRGHPRSRRGRGQPRLRAHRLRLCRGVHRPRPHDARRAQQGRPRATSSRSTPWATSATTRSRTPPQPAAPTPSS